MNKILSLAAAVSVGLNLTAAIASDFLPLPQAPLVPHETQSEIVMSWQATGSDYSPRTHHLRSDGTPEYANRLLLERSPYLRQHAHNPVNWYAWGDEAFAVAREMNRPILVSIGYSSCHWCHVMEEESYDNLEIAKLLNREFVAVKVDRETHPDVDAIYLLAVQVMGSNGGWPLHAFLTPEGKPFLGMTYLPPAEFTQILDAVWTTWKNDQQELEVLAQQITDVLQSFEHHQNADVEIGTTQINQIVSELSQLEAERDGFPPAQSSFPFEAGLLMLLEWALREPQSAALNLAESQLQGMAHGGFHDHIGGGFHRYTVDGEWMIPHFEKMLYNQAHLGRAYLYGYQITGEPLYRRAAERTLDYVLRDMTGAGGLFFSSTDADSEGEEGVFFIWTLEEILDAAGDDYEFAVRHFGATEGGNFESRNILFTESISDDIAREFSLTHEQYLQRVDQVSEKMRRYRDRREKPFRDEKSIVTWNAAMITTLAEASVEFPDKAYLQAALKAADNLWTVSMDHEGQLYRIVINGEREEPAKLQDYAYFMQAALAVYDRTKNRIWLDRAQVLADAVIEQFWDLQRGGFFSVAYGRDESLIVRQKGRFDDALPSDNAVVALAFSRLYKRNGNVLYERYSQQVFDAFAGEIFSIPTSYPYMLKALKEHRHGPVLSPEYIAWGNAVADFTVQEASNGRINGVIEINFEDGWHVQANEVSDESLTATEVRLDTPGWTLESLSYPPAKSLKIESLEMPLSVWSGSVRIPVVLSGTPSPSQMPVITVDLQACNDEVCLFPESIRLEIPFSKAAG